MTRPLSALTRPRRSITARVMFLVSIGTLTTLSVLGLVSLTELARADANLVREREAVASGVARSMDEHLTEVLAALQRLANDTRGLLPVAEHSDQLQQEAHAVWLEAAFLDGLFIATLDGTVLVRVPPGHLVPSTHLSDAVSRVRQAPRPAVTSLVPSEGSAGRLLVVVPLRDWQGQLTGVVAGDLDPQGRRFAQLAAPITQVPLGAVDVLDGAGHVLASSDLHAPGPSPAPIVAVAALEFAPWRVVAHRSDGEAGPVEKMLRRLLWLGPLLVGGSLLLAWGAAWSVRKPLVALTGAADRLAGGDLESPVTVEGQDEIGRLGRAFEAMREALKATRDEIEKVNMALETRVEERTRELARVNRELRDRERVRQSLLRKVITAQEDERKRVARELHDEACQTVTALGLRLEAALATATPGTMGHEELSHARELARRSLEELHQLMHDLRPALLDDLGLVAAVRWYAERRLAAKGIAVRFEATMSTLRLPLEVEIALFRAVQEAITNVERHAQAEMVLVQMTVEQRDLLIDVEDDGVGFDPATTVPTPGNARGLGLLGIRERLELVGGVATIESSPGNGTHVAIRVSLPEGVVDAEDSRVDR